MAELWSLMPPSIINLVWRPPPAICRLAAVGAGELLEAEAHLLKGKVFTVAVAMRGDD